MTSQTLLVFGQTGQVARELERLAPDAIFADRDIADLSDPAGCAALIRDRRPERIINAAAYTAVDKAEDDEALALLVNGDAPAAMAQAARDVGAVFVHISSDYVFDGSGTAPWRETDATDPLGAYGRSKLAGEQGVQRVGGAFAILRTSWVFSVHGRNFVKTMLRLGAERDMLTVVSDQIGGPTPAADIAKVCLTLADALVSDPRKAGIYHYSGAPDVSWAQFATAVFEAAGLQKVVKGIATKDYPTPAKRPANSRLNCLKLETRLGVTRPSWQAGLRKVLTELEAEV